MARKHTLLTICLTAIAVSLVWTAAWILAREGPPLGTSDRPRATGERRAVLHEVGIPPRPDPQALANRREEVLTKVPDASAPLPSLTASPSNEPLAPIDVRDSGFSFIRSCLREEGIQLPREMALPASVLAELRGIAAELRVKEGVLRSESFNLRMELAARKLADSGIGDNETKTAPRLTGNAKPERPGQMVMQVGNVIVRIDPGESEKLDDLEAARKAMRTECASRALGVLRLHIPRQPK